MTYKEYCKIMDNSNFYPDNSNSSDMKIINILEKQVNKSPEVVTYTDGGTEYLCSSCKKRLCMIFGDGSYYEYERCLSLLRATFRMGRIREKNK